MSDKIISWILFNILIFFLLALDLGVFHRKAHIIKVKEALIWSAFWIILALIFNLGIYFWQGKEKALEFLTGYLIEKSLSVDNIFVFYLIFSYFSVPSLYQHKVLFWGIVGAVIMRFIFILTGVALIEKFHFLIYIFGIFLTITGIKIGLKKEKEINPEKNPILKLFKRFLPITENYKGGKFFLKRDKKVFATPLFIVLLVVETTDVVFAVDSIPAIFAITLDPFIIYTSNIFAILGLRALYFALAGIIGLFCYLHYGLGFIIVFVGIKMLISDFYKIPISLALGVIAITLIISIIVSILRKKNEKVI